MGSLVAARAAHVTLQGLRMTAPGLLSCSSFPALLALFIALLISLLSVNPTEASWFTQDHFMNLKFNRSLFRDVSRECSLEGKFEAVINRNNPAYLLKLDGKDNTVFSQQTFDCVIKVRTEWYTNRTRRGQWVNGRWQEYNPHQEKYDDNNDLSVMIFDINHGYRRKEDAIRLELVHISKQESRRSNEHGLNTRFFYQKKKFQLPQYVPKHVHGYVLNGFDEIDQWHAESNASLKIDLRRWQTSGSIYFVFTQYRIVSPYHCNTGIEVDCDDRSSVFARCFPASLLPLFMDDFPFCEFRPLYAIGSNRTSCGSADIFDGRSNIYFFLLAVLQLLVPLVMF